MKIKMTLSIGLVGHQNRIEEVPDEELEGMDEDEIENYIVENYVEPWANQYIEYGFDKEDDG